MNKTKNALLGIVSALALAAGAGFALYSCDGFADAAAQAAGAEADASRMGGGTGVQWYEIRGPKGWVAYVFSSAALGGIETYVLGTDRTVRLEDRWGYANDRLRKQVEAAGITITGSYSTNEFGESCWVEFNLKQITEFKRI
jgi:hypothetical protein